MDLAVVLGTAHWYAGGICFSASSREPVGEKDITGPAGVKADCGKYKQATEPTALAFSSYTHIHTHLKIPWKDPSSAPVCCHPLLCGEMLPFGDNPPLL